MNEFDLLKNALSEAKYVPHEHLPVGPEELHATGLAFARVNEIGSLGFTPAGRTCIHRLASVLHERDERFRRGASLAAFREKVASAALDYYDQRANLAYADVAGLKNKLEQWFQGHTKAETHLVPCALLPQDARSFNVGPVRFISAGQLEAEGIKTAAFGDWLSNFANSRNARWFARVEVRGEDARRRELANAAVDLALASLHLVLPLDPPMHRVSNRAVPDWVMSFTLDDSGEVWPGQTTSNTPADALSSEYFDLAIDANAALLKSCGARIQAFLSVDEALDGMSHAWCDAAYWYFEAASDELDTVALAKLEACLENLTSSTKGHKSNSRLRGLVQRVLGVPLARPLSDNAPLTYGGFVEELVEARSRVLHGTASTLTGGAKLTRAEATKEAARLLKATSFLMDRYREVCPGSELSLDAFQDWTHRERENARAASQQNTPPHEPAPGETLAKDGGA